jgi:UPF0755 protein
MKRFMIVVVALLVLFGAALFALNQYVQRPLDIPAQGVAFKIAPGTSVQKVARDLEAKGLVPNARLAAAAARMWDIAPRIQAGDYQIVGPHTLRSLLESLTTGKAKQLKFTIIEGTTLREVIKALNASPDFKKEPPLTVDSVGKHFETEGKKLEGWFFPDTYFLAEGGSRYTFLERAREKMLAEVKEITKEIKFDADDSPYGDTLDFVTLASIIEKETGDPRDRGKVASVFVNRMRIEMPLQTDPTVIYGLGEKFDGNLTRQHLRTDNEYNTYTRRGYPPTPIAMPGRASLLAAANPDTTKYLYFVARGDGTSEFSETLDQHNRAVRKFQLKQGK